MAGRRVRRSTSVGAVREQNGDRLLVVEDELHVLYEVMIEVLVLYQVKLMKEHATHALVVVKMKTWVRFALLLALSSKC